MSWPLSERWIILLAVLAWLAVPFIGYQLGIPTNILPYLSFIGGFLILFYVFTHHHPKFWFRQIVRRLEKGEAEQVLAEALEKRANGDCSYQNALCLAVAYSYQGRGMEAEPVAREALAAIEAAGWPARINEENARYICGWAYYAVHDALLMQGRFAEAADVLRPHLESSPWRNFNTLLVAWNYFLVGDTEKARQMFAQYILSPVQRQDVVPPHYLVLVAYLEYKLFDTGAEERIRNLSEHLAKFDEEIERLAENPYRARLREMVAEIRELIA